MLSLEKILRDFEGKTVLVAEDDFLVAAQTEETLRAAGLHVVGTAATAEETIDLAERERPALVVMDVRLAGKLDGVEAAGQLYERFNIRCIFATANDDRFVRERAEHYSPLGWLSKPYTMASLLGAVADALIELR